MHKIPRDISSDNLIKKLKMFDYTIVRQTGSHIRLTSNKMDNPHYLTIPKKSSLKVGTLNSILKDIAEYLKISKEELLEKLFLNRG